MLPLSKNVAFNSEIKSNKGRCEGWSGKGGERGVALVRAVGYAFRADCQGFGDGLRKERQLSNSLDSIAFLQDIDMGLLKGHVLRNPHLSLRREWHTLLAATLGTLLTCFAVVGLTVPYQFAGGGVLGLALISNYAWGISPAWVLSIGNAVLLLWGWKALSLRFALWTLYVTALTSVAIHAFELFQYPVIGNTILAAPDS